MALGSLEEFVSSCGSATNELYRQPQEYSKNTVGIRRTDSKKLEHGCKVIDNGVPSFFGLGCGEWASSKFLASTARTYLPIIFQLDVWITDLKSFRTIPVKDTLGRDREHGRLKRDRSLRERDLRRG